MTIAAVGILVVGTAAALALLLWPESEAPVDVNAELVAGTEAVSDSMRVFSRANLFEDLSVASTTAAEASEALDARLAVVAEAEDEELRAAATEVLEAQQATLTSFANTFSNYRTQDFGRWDAREQTMQARLNRLSQAQDELVALENDEITARIDVAAAERYSPTSATWSVTSRTSIRRGEGGADRGSGISGGDLVRPPGLRRSSSRAIMAEYSALRTELAEWTQEIDRRFVSIAEGYSRARPSGIGPTGDPQPVCRPSGARCHGISPFEPAERRG